MQNITDLYYNMTKTQLEIKLIQTGVKYFDNEL